MITKVKASQYINQITLLADIRALQVANKDNGYISMGDRHKLMQKFKQRYKSTQRGLCLLQNPEKFGIMKRNEVTICQYHKLNMARVIACWLYECNLSHKVDSIFFPKHWDQGYKNLVRKNMILNTPLP